MSLPKRKVAVPGQNQILNVIDDNSDSSGDDDTNSTYGSEGHVDDTLGNIPPEDRVPDWRPVRPPPIIGDKEYVEADAMVAEMQVERWEREKAKAKDFVNANSKKELVLDNSYKLTENVPKVVKSFGSKAWLEKEAKDLALLKQEMESILQNTARDMDEFMNRQDKRVSKSLEKAFSIVEVQKAPVAAWMMAGPQAGSSGGSGNRNQPQGAFEMFLSERLAAQEKAGVPGEDRHICEYYYKVDLSAVRARVYNCVEDYREHVLELLKRVDEYVSDMQRELMEHRQRALWLENRHNTMVEALKKQEKDLEFSRKQIQAREEKMGELRSAFLKEVVGLKQQVFRDDKFMMNSFQNLLAEQAEESKVPTVDPKELEDARKEIAQLKREIVVMKERREADFKKGAAELKGLEEAVGEMRQEIAEKDALLEVAEEERRQLHECQERLQDLEADNHAYKVEIENFSDAFIKVANGCTKAIGGKTGLEESFDPDKLVDVCNSATETLRKMKDEDSMPRSKSGVPEKKKAMRLLDTFDKYAYNIHSCAKVMENLREELKKLRSESKEVQEKLTHKVEKLEFKVKESEMLMQQEIGLKTEAQKDAQQAKQDLEAHLLEARNSESALYELKDRLKDQTSLLHTHESTIEELTRKVADLEEQLNDSNQKISHLQVQREADVSRLRAEADAAQEERNRLASVEPQVTVEKVMVTETAAVSVPEEYRIEMEQTVARLRSTNDQLQGKVDKLNSEVSRLRDLLQVAEASLLKYKMAEMDQLHTDVNAASEEKPSKDAHDDFINKLEVYGRLEVRGRLLLEKIARIRNDLGTQQRKRVTRVLKENRLADDVDHKIKLVNTKKGYRALDVVLSPSKTATSTTFQKIEIHDRVHHYKAHADHAGPKHTMKRTKLGKAKGKENTLSSSISIQGRAPPEPRHEVFPSQDKPYEPSKQRPKSASGHRENAQTPLFFPSFSPTPLRTQTFDALEGDTANNASMIGAESNHDSPTVRLNINRSQIEDIRTRQIEQHQELKSGRHSSRDNRGSHGILTTGSLDTAKESILQNTIGQPLMIDSKSYDNPPKDSASRPTSAPSKRHNITRQPSTGGYKV